MSKLLTSLSLGLTLFSIGCGGGAVEVDNPKDVKDRPNEEQLKKMHEEAQNPSAQNAAGGSQPALHNQSQK